MKSRVGFCLLFSRKRITTVVGGAVAAVLLSLSVAWACTGLGAGFDAVLLVTPGTLPDTATATVAVAPGFDNGANPVLYSTNWLREPGSSDEMPCGGVAPGHDGTTLTPVGTLAPVGPGVPDPLPPSSWWTTTNPNVGVGYYNPTQMVTNPSYPKSYFVYQRANFDIPDDEDNVGTYGKPDDERLPGDFRWYCAYQPGFDGIVLNGKGHPSVENSTANWTTTPFLFGTL